MNRSVVLFACTLLALCFATQAGAQHVDILVFEQDGKLQTGRADYDRGDGSAPVPVPGRTAFSRGFEDIEINFQSGDDPGFNSTSDFDLPGNAPLYYRNIPFTLPTGPTLSNLWYWDGVDVNGNGDYLEDVTFGAPPTGTAFSRLFIGNLRETVTGTNETMDWVFIQNSNPAGIVHKHITWAVTGNGFVSLNVGGTAPDPGLYLVAFELSIGGDSNVPGTDPENSEPVYIAFNVDSDTAAEAAAVAWINSAVIPEPSTAVLAMAGVGLLLARRRKTA